MRKQMTIKTLALLLVLSLCMSILPSSVFAVSESKTANDTAPTLEDFLAGNATAEDIYGVLDESTVPEIIGYEEAVRKNHVRRLYEDEGEELNKVVFLNVDGSKTMYTFDFPVKYIDEDGNIRDITLEIADSTTQSGEFESAANAAITTFSAQFTDGITLTGSDAEIRLVPVLPSVVSGTTTMSSSSILDSSANPVPEAQRIDENTIEYSYDDVTTVEYSLTYTGFKEDIVVREYTGQTEYPFRLYTNGLALEEIDGSYFLVDDYGDIQATIGDIIIFTADERNNTFGSIVPMTVVENEEYLLTIVVDADYLADPNTTYPIRIDPTVEIDYNDGASAIEDITITTNTNYTGSHTSLYVGRRSTEGIARALMRFPGLDLTGLEGATVTSASVRVRDLMCEDTPLDISCHVFTGNVWDANSATWASVNPNSYVSTALSTNTLSWSIGDTFDPIHWYSFDITSAVQGWIDGNYTQSKGIIFKTSNTVENGSTIANRTFGSFNRASYKPSLSVTYTSAGSQILANNTYYINNKYSGHYMQYTTNGTIAGTAGYISSLSDTIRWDVQKVSNGYVLRAKSDPTKYLGTASNASSTAVEVVTISDAAIPTRCIWNITYASGGGCLIRSSYNANYLYTYGTTLYTSSTLGEPGYSAYNSRVWRIASTSYYGNTSSYSTRELTSGFSISNLIVNIGATKYPSISKAPTNALWANAEDFTFSRSSGTSGCISITLPENKFTGTKIGIATYTAKHKVTNRSVTFKVYVDRYTYELTEEFGFSDTAALLIRDVYNKIDTAYPNDSTLLRAWRASRVLGGVIYGNGVYSGVKWADVAGIAYLGDEDDYFTNTLGFTTTEYSQIKAAITSNYSDTSTGDFAHMQISLSARLAYQLNRNGILSNIGTFCSDEDVSYLSGWLGDATLVGDNGQTSMKNDDYHADLDAENIYRLIAQGYTLVNATNVYYTSLTSTNTRATKFLSYIDYETVKDKIYEELVDKDLRLMMALASEQGNMTLYWYYYDLLSDEQYHLDVIKGYPDTYNFMCSIRDGRSDIGSY